MGQIEAWQGMLSGLHERFAERFARSEPRARALTYMAGLIAPLERKNGWTLAERAGEGHPIGMQRLLGEADWDADGVRDDVRDFVVATIGTKDGILIGDDTGFLKKGTGSAGVQRQYTGTAGARISITVSDGFPRGLFGRVAVPVCGRAIRVSA